MDARDVVVVGGGIVGTATAYHVARRGLSVTLLEGERVAWGASGRNIGYIWLHTRRPGVELDLVRPTRATLEELPAELDADIGLRTGGSLIAFDREEQAPVFREFVEARRADGLDVRLLEGPELRALCPILPETALGASFCADDAQIDPGRYSAAYARAAARLGVEVREGVRVERLTRIDGRVTGVLTAEGPIEAGTVVLAAGPWSPALAATAGIELPIRSMRLQVLRTEPLDVRLEQLYYGAVAVKQYAIFRELPSFREEAFVSEIEAHHGLVLLEAACQTQDGSFLLGIAMDYPGLVQQPTLEGVALIAAGLTRSLPALRGAPFARAWAGVLPYTADNLPIVGPAPGLDGLVIAAGHVFGNAAGPTTGRLVADLVSGDPPIVDPTPLRADRPGLAFADEASTW